jgi:hypothetical protein
VSLTPAKYRNNRISLRRIKKIEIVSGHVYWAQEEQFEEKTRGKKSRGTVTLRFDVRGTFGQRKKYVINRNTIYRTCREYFVKKRAFEML